jgi:hypothetical protein
MDLLCKWCKETKPEDLFVKRRADLPYSQSNVRCCRECNTERNRQRYKNPTIRAKQLRANALWRKAHPDEMARYAKKLNSSRPDQQRARARVRYLIRKGYWQRRECEICRRGDAEAHHDSYARAHWETVRWLCKKHHEQWHERLDPVKNSIVAEPLAEVEQLRDEAAEIQRQITALRDRYRELHVKANALELSTWNKVVEAAQPMFEEFINQRGSQGLPPRMCEDLGA